MRRFQFVLSLSALAMATSTANAVLVTNNNFISPTVIDFEQFGSQINVNAGVQVGSSVGEDVFLTAFGDHRVGPMSHSMGANGFWTRSGALNNDDFNGVMTFTFNDGAVAAVGGFVNYAPGFGPGTALMEVLGAGDVLLESYDLVSAAPISTPSAFNDGAFRGIVRAQADIVALRLSYAFNVIDDLAFTRTVPEPATTALSCIGLVIVGLRRIRREFR